MFKQAKVATVRISYDSEVDALYVRLNDSTIVESAEVHPGIVLDFNAENEVVGIEVLRVQDRVPLAQLKQIPFGSL